MFKSSRRTRRFKRRRFRNPYNRSLRRASAATFENVVDFASRFLLRFIISLPFVRAASFRRSLCQKEFLCNFPKTSLS